MEMTHLIIPEIKVILSKLVPASIQLAPIPDTGYVHDIIKTIKKKDNRKYEANITISRVKEVGTCKEETLHKKK